MSPGRSVTIRGSGRSGHVVYRDPEGELAFEWELGGGDTVASVRVGTEAEWSRGWASDRRGEIVRFVADEMARQKAPSCVPEIDERSGWIHLRAGTSTPRTTPAAGPSAFVRRWRSLRNALALGVLTVALVLGGVAWLARKVLVIDPGKGTPVGPSVRTDRHVATLIQTLEPYTPSLHRDHSKDTYSVGLFLVPLDGAEPRLVPISGGLSGGALGLVKILGGDGRTLWFDVNGVGGIDLATLEAVRSGAPRVAQGLPRSPLAPRTEAYLSAGFFTGPDAWLGLCSVEEAERTFAPGRWVRPVVPAEAGRALRRFHRGVVGEVSGTGSRKLVAMEALGAAEYLEAAFLRTAEDAEPLRLRDPDGALVVFTSAPGPSGTLVVARVDTSGRLVWKVDTGLDRFALRQVLPGEDSFAFIGTRPAVPDRVPEPLLVVVGNATGEVTTHSLWR